MTENIVVFKHNSIRIGTEQGMVYVDPFEMTEEPKDAAFILITHDHYDHFSPEAIEKVANGNTVLVVPEKMAAKAQKVAGIVGKIVTVNPNEKKEIDGLQLETVPAYNILKPFHPKSAEWVGYIVNANGKRVYAAGDTDLTNEAKEVKCDVTLVPIGGMYTMDAKKAAELVNTIQPEVAIPVHYGAIIGSEKDGKEFEKLVKAPTKVELKIKF
ncbi:MAG: MBL fold metallo-hydrolase [Lachnospiraceae bacterium]|nr:MBL fold metallo-hydrolase [Lachnospiraceae bacterium]